MVVQHETKEDGETALQDGGGQLLNLGPPGGWGGKMENQDGVLGAYGIKMKDLLIEIDAAYVAMLLRIVLD